MFSVRCESSIFVSSNPPTPSICWRYALCREGLMNGKRTTLGSFAQFTHTHTDTYTQESCALYVSYWTCQSLCHRPQQLYVCSSLAYTPALLFLHVYEWVCVYGNCHTVLIQCIHGVCVWWYWLNSWIPDFLFGPIAHTQRHQHIHTPFGQKGTDRER